LNLVYPEDIVDSPSKGGKIEIRKSADHVGSVTRDMNVVIITQVMFKIPTNISVTRPHVSKSTWHIVKDIRTKVFETYFLKFTVNDGVPLNYK
jgi:hypothetical protein